MQEKEEKYIKFLEDIKYDDGETIWFKNNVYRIISENKNFYVIEQGLYSGQHGISKSEEGKLFKVVNMVSVKVGLFNVE